MLFRLQNAANSLTSPTMTVPFDTDVLLFLVSATSPSGHTQPMEVHAYVSVEQWPLWNPVRWATVPPVLPRKGRPTAWPGLPPGATKVRPRSRPRKKNILVLRVVLAIGPISVLLLLGLPLRAWSRTPSCRLLLRYLYGPPFFSIERK